MSSLASLPRCACTVPRAGEATGTAHLIPAPQRNVIPLNDILPWRPGATHSSEVWFRNTSFPLLQLLLFPPTPGTCSPSHCRFFMWADFHVTLPPCDSSSFAAPHLTPNKRSITGQAPNHWNCVKQRCRKPPMEEQQISIILENAWVWQCFHAWKQIYKLLA